jgi:hypothetical protein
MTAIWAKKYSNLIVFALIGFHSTSGEVLAFANGATPTTEPPTIATCTHGAILVEIGSPWSTDNTRASISVSLVDYESKSSRLIEIGQLSGLVLTFDGVGLASPGQTIEIKLNSSLKGYVELVADIGSVTVSSFGDGNKDCSAQAELTR